MPKRRVRSIATFRTMGYTNRTRCDVASESCPLLTTDAARILLRHGEASLVRVSSPVLIFLGKVVNDVLRLLNSCCERYKSAGPTA